MKITQIKLLVLHLVNCCIFPLSFEEFILIFMQISTHLKRLLNLYFLYVNFIYVS